MKILKVINIESMINFIVMVFFVFITFVFNKLPNGSIVATGDFYQSFNATEHLSRYFYTWINQIGQGAYNTLSSTGLYYTILSVLEQISNIFGVSNSNFIQFIFLISSFYSAKYFCKIFFNLSKLENTIFSLFYALNPVTFAILSYSWGYTHHVLYYLFLPALLASFYEVISSSKNKFEINLAKFSIIQLIAIMIINNIAFAVLVLGFYLLVFLITYIRKELGLNITKFIFTIVSMFFSFYWYFISNVYQLSNLSSKLTSNKVIGNLDDWLRGTSSNFKNIFSMSHDTSSLLGFNSIFTISFLFPMIILLVLYLTKNSKYSNIPFIFILIVLGFAVRVYGIFGQLNLYLYQLPGINILRSPDKLIFSLPIIFLFCIIFYYRRSGFKHKRFLIILILSPCIVFIFGVISGVLQGRNYGVGGYYSKVVTIPNSYNEVKKNINSKNDSSVIVNLPYSVSTSINWVNYPKWNFVGHDITHLLYKKNMIFTNSFDNPSLENQMSFKLDELPLKDDKDLLERLQRFGAKYVFIHKDIDPYWMKDSQMYSLMLASSTYAQKLDSNDYFDLYKIKDEFIASHILSSSNLTFQKTNPTHYSIWLKGLKVSTSLEFLESYHPEWKLYVHKWGDNKECKNAITQYETSNTTECEPKNIFLSGIEFYASLRKNLQIAENTHAMVKGYANGWTIDENEIRKLGQEYYHQNEDGSIDVNIDLYFKPQSYFIYGLTISIITFTSCVAYLGYAYHRDKRQKV